MCTVLRFDENGKVLSEENYTDALTTIGTRMQYIPEVIAPLREDLQPPDFQRLVAALAMIWGIEGYVVLRDICGLSTEEAGDVLRWTARAIVRSARETSGRRRPHITP